MVDYSGFEYSGGGSYGSGFNLGGEWASAGAAAGQDILGGTGFSLGELPSSLAAVLGIGQGVINTMNDPTITASMIDAANQSGEMGGFPDMGGWRDVTGSWHPGGGYGSGVPTGGGASGDDLLSFIKEQIKSPATGEIGSGLSDEQMALIDTIRSTGMANIQSAIEKPANEIFQRTIAEMVDRGVLQGDIGSQAMQGVAEDVAKAVADSTGALEGDIAKLVLQLMDSSKSQDIAWELGKMGIDVNKLHVGTNIYTSDADRALRQALANLELEQRSDSDKWGFAGNIAGLIGTLLT